MRCEEGTRSKSMHENLPVLKNAARCGGTRPQSQRSGGRDKHISLSSVDDNLKYKMNSRLAKTAQRDPVSNRTKNEHPGRTWISKLKLAKCSSGNFQAQRQV